MRDDEKGTPEPDIGTDGDGTTAEVFGAFLRLGLTSFGGPLAHLGYFRNEFVDRRRWLSDERYADLVALCQFLPGPASSQVGFALGFMRAGWAGALMAFFAFTLPSAILMLLAAMLTVDWEGEAAARVVAGLKIVALVVVADAVFGMAKSLSPDARRAGIAVAAFACALLVAGPFAQLAAICLGAVAGLVLCRAGSDPAAPAGRERFAIGRRTGTLALLAFAGLFVLLPLAASFGAFPLAILDAFYRAGALVFGGGHVVLPLLEAETVSRGWISGETFLAGYGAAQALPGPLFTFAAYLGAATAAGGASLAHAAIALVAIFLPGFLILVAALAFRERLRAMPSAGAAMRGAGAAVVGLLAAALVDPVLPAAIHRPLDLALALGGFLLLRLARMPPIAVVAVLVTVTAGTFR